MRLSLLLLTGLAAVLPAHGAEPVSLFDGRDLAGWVAVPSVGADGQPIWSAPDGVIRCAGTPKGYLRTKVAYSDYHLQVQWRWPGRPGNSGVFVHGSGADKVWPLCYEAQLAAGKAGEIRANGGIALQAGGKSDQRFVPRQAAASERAPGEWNDYDIVCQGDTITLSVNGVRQNELKGAAATRGWIALQSEGGVIEFRGLILTPLRGG